MTCLCTYFLRMSYIQIYCGSYYSTSKYSFLIICRIRDLTLGLNFYGFFNKYLEGSVAEWECMTYHSHTFSLCCTINWYNKL
jgi:hypothetical protein